MRKKAIYFACIGLLIISIFQCYKVKENYREKKELDIVVQDKTSKLQKNEKFVATATKIYKYKDIKQYIDKYNLKYKEIKFSDDKWIVNCSTSGDYNKIISTISSMNTDKIMYDVVAIEMKEKLWIMNVILKFS